MPRLALFLVFIALLVSPASSAPTSRSDVTKATLSNGLQVVIVRNTLAPVVSTVMTYLVGTRDDPSGFPGMAHAQEHMMFRGTKQLSTSELGTVATALGGNFNASTSDTLTQLSFTVPASNLDAILRIESDRMSDILDAQSEWQNERGAIEQEVLRDESTPGGDFFADAQAIAFAGTPYAHQGVGTVAAFNRLTGPELKKFYERWYAPNNAVFVIAGNVDPAAVLAQVRARFESIPKRPAASHAPARLAALHRTNITRPTTLVYPLAAVGFRLPGIESPDFLAAFVLQQMLGSERGPFRALVDSGASIDAEWTPLPYLPVGQLAFATAALPQGGDPSAMAKRLERIVTEYAQHGVPRELFETTKRQAISGQELSRNSIASLASDWSTTIALDNEPSIEREQQLIAGVTLADVDRVAKRYLNVDHAIVGALTPSADASKNAAAAPPQLGTEKPLAAAQAPAQHLPPWAADLLSQIAVPPSGLTPVRSTLPNGITLIVQPETISDSVFLFGAVKSNADLQEPAGQEGVASVLETMFDLGTQTQDRAAFQRSQDEIDSQISAGTSFGIQTTAKSFAGAVGLLAQNELHPRFESATFGMARERASQELATALNSTGTVATRRLNSKLLPPGDPTLREPTQAALGRLTLDSVKSYYDLTVRPDQTTIVIVGNISPDAARATVEQSFGAWRAPATQAMSLDLPPVPQNEPSEEKLTLPIGQDSVTLAEMIPLPRTAPSYYGLQLGNAVLGGGSVSPEQSRLFRDLRQNAGLVYSIASELQTQDSRTRFSIDFASLPGNQDRIVSMIDDQVERLKTQPVGSFELSLIKASIVRKTVIGDASIESIGSSMLGYASSGLPLDQSRIDAEHILGTSAEAVQAAFAGFVHPKSFVKLVVGS